MLKRNRTKSSHGWGFKSAIRSAAAFGIAWMLVCPPLPTMADGLPDEEIPKSREVKAEDVLDTRYQVFWSQHENIFLFKPELVREVFYGIVRLKGDPIVAKRYIDFEVLGCPVSTDIAPGCRIDRLELEREKLNLPRTVTIPVNFSEVTRHPYSGDEQKRIISLQWRPILFQPPIFSVADFLDYIEAAPDSKYYQVRPGLKRIQLSPVFQSEIDILMSVDSAENLIALYEVPPTDLRDTLVFSIADVHMKTVQDKAVFTLELRSDKVKINHRLYQPPPHQLL